MSDKEGTHTVARAVESAPDSPVRAASTISSVVSTVGIMVVE